MYKMIKALLCFNKKSTNVMCLEVTNNDISDSKEVKEGRSRATSTIYTVDTTQKTAMNGMAINYSSDQSPLSTVTNPGHQKNAAVAWRYFSTSQSDVRGRSSLHHAAKTNRRPANNECLRRSESSNPAEVIIESDYLPKLIPGGPIKNVPFVISFFF